MVFLTPADHDQTQMGFILDFKTKMEDYKKAIDECKAYFCILSLDCMIRKKN